jgi:hypothetical protein
MGNKAAALQETSESVSLWTAHSVLQYNGFLLLEAPLSQHLHYHHCLVSPETHAVYSSVTAPVCGDWISAGLQRVYFRLAHMCCIPRNLIMNPYSNKSSEIFLNN